VVSRIWSVVSPIYYSEYQRFINNKRASGHQDTKKRYSLSRRDFWIIRKPPSGRMSI
jgi:hypothetical protein